MKEQTKGTLQMLCCAALWSIAGIFIKQIEWNAFVIAGGRSLIAAASIFIYMKSAGHKIKLDKSSFATGVFLCLTFLLFVTANKLTTAANAIVLQFTNPLFILLISALVLKQKLKRADILAVAFTFFGITLFFLDDMGAGKLLGNLCGIGAGLVFGIALTLIGNADEEKRMNGIFWGNLFTAAVGLPVAFFTVNVFSVGSFVRIAILGVFQLGIPYILLVFASRTCPPLVCSLLGALEPLLNPLWVFLFDGEVPGTLSFIGAAVVVTTITLWCIFKDKKPARLKGEAPV